MTESLSRTPSRFSVFLVLSNISILLLLLVWIWRYWHNGAIADDASSIDDFFIHKARFLILNKYSFEAYIFNLVFGLVVFLLLLPVTDIKNPVIARTLLATATVLVLADCVFIQSKVGVLHLWVNAVILAFCQNLHSCDLMSKQKSEGQDFDKASSGVIQAICALTFLLYCCTFPLEV